MELWSELLLQITGWAVATKDVYLFTLLQFHLKNSFDISLYGIIFHAILAKHIPSRALSPQNVSMYTIPELSAVLLECHASLRNSYSLKLRDIKGLHFSTRQIFYQMRVTHNTITNHISQANWIFLYQNFLKISHQTLRQL